MQVLDNLMVVFGLKIYEFEIYNKNQKQKKLLEKKFADEKILKDSTVLDILKSFGVLNLDLESIKQNIVDYGFAIVETKNFETMVEENEQSLSFFAMICSFLISPWSFGGVSRFFMFITLQFFILLWSFEKVGPGWGVFFMFTNYFFFFVVPKLFHKYLFNMVLAKDMKDYKNGSFIIIPKGLLKNGKQVFDIEGIKKILMEYVNIGKNGDKLNILTFEYLKTDNTSGSSSMAMQEFKNDFINSMEKNYKKFYLEFLTKSFYRI